MIAGGMERDEFETKEGSGLRGDREGGNVDEVMDGADDGEMEEGFDTSGKVAGMDNGVDVCVWKSST